MYESSIDHAASPTHVPMKQSDQFLSEGSPCTRRQLTQHSVVQPLPLSAAEILLTNEQPVVDGNDYLIPNEGIPGTANLNEKPQALDENDYLIPNEDIPKIMDPNAKSQTNDFPLLPIGANYDGRQHISYVSGRVSEELGHIIPSNQADVDLTTSPDDAKHIDLGGDNDANDDDGYLILDAAEM